MLFITGMGAVSPIGVGIPDYAAALRHGRSGVRPLGFSHPLMKSTVAAPVGPEVFDPCRVVDPADVRRLPRLVPMALGAAREAMRQAGLEGLHSSHEAREQSDTRVRAARRIGLVLGTGAGGIDFTLDQAIAGYSPESSGRPSLWTITNATHGNLAGELSIRLGLRGPSWCVSTGCASSSDALGMAMAALSARSPRPPDVDAFVVVGADAHVRWETLHGMELLRVISTRDWGAAGEVPESASRPFDQSRDGFVLGEGAWAVVVERAESASRREIRPVAEMLGYGATCDAYHRVRPDPDMAESVRAMHLAIDEAGLAPGAIDLIHYHGTATRLNDACETAAVKAAFGNHAPRLRGTSVKGMIGHPQGACGLASLVATLAGLRSREPFIPPTINLRTPDPECDLDYTPNTAGALQRGRTYTALVNCLAFGAKNSALLVRAVAGETASEPCGRTATQP